MRGGNLGALFPEGWVLGCCFGAISTTLSCFLSLFHATVSLCMLSGQVCGFDEDPAIFSLCGADVWPHVCFTKQQSAHVFARPLAYELGVIGNKIHHPLKILEPHQPSLACPGQKCWDKCTNFLEQQTMASRAAIKSSREQGVL